MSDDEKKLMDSASEIEQMDPNLHIAKAEVAGKNTEISHLQSEIKRNHARAVGLIVGLKKELTKSKEKMNFFRKQSLEEKQRAETLEGRVKELEERNLALTVDMAVTRDEVLTARKLVQDRNLTIKVIISAMDGMPRRPKKINLRTCIDMIEQVLRGTNIRKQILVDEKTESVPDDSPQRNTP